MVTTIAASVINPRSTYIILYIRNRNATKSITKMYDEVYNINIIRYVILYYSDIVKFDDDDDVELSVCIFIHIDASFSFFP